MSPSGYCVALHNVHGEQQGHLVRDRVTGGNRPLVSIGVPVRNGARFLDEALVLLREQTYNNIEIIISDNASDDGSTAIIERHAGADDRIRVHRTEGIRTALNNFRFVFEQARGDYFMWAACDDRRSLNYVESLLVTMLGHPEASIAFGDVACFSDCVEWRAATPMPYRFESDPTESRWARFSRYIRIQNFQIYGLIRVGALQSYRWVDIDHGPDNLLLMHLAFQGEFVRAATGCFYYYAPIVQKSPEERAMTNNLHKLKRFPELRFAWACAVEVHRLTSATGENITKLRAFILVYAYRHWLWIKPALFRISPRPLVRVYRKWFKRGYS